MLEPNSSGAVLDPNKKTINVSSNSEFDTESEEESEHLSIPRTPKSQSSEQVGASNNSKTSEKVIWERKAVPRKDRSRNDIYYYYIQGSKDRFHCWGLFWYPRLSWELGWVPPLKHPTQPQPGVQE
ncbi:hypothetical protein AVEN_84316-1 [Araneus ventricosus]|uniref:Uncharacterized protein n=1 Tax=Araneus ventricosus TaxID=182803 RepID=A0A4Y2QVI9_ARAVE|nr:hypothetical protein AVEN_84316-1 [Araneus ventricosus]